MFLMSRMNIIQKCEKLVLSFSNKNLFHYGSHSIIQLIFSNLMKYQYHLIFLVQKLEKFSKSYHPSQVILITFSTRPQWVRRNHEFTLSLRLMTCNCYAPTRSVLTKWLSVCLWTRWLRVQIPLQALNGFTPESNSQLWQLILFAIEDFLYIIENWCNFTYFF